MKVLKYKEFLRLVLEASGPFSYWFLGLGTKPMVCDPLIWIARNYGTRERVRLAAYGPSYWDNFGNRDNQGE